VGILTEIAQIKEKFAGQLIMLKTLN